MKVLLIYPRRDPRSRVRWQYDWKKLFELVSWPVPLRAYGMYTNVLDTLASLTPSGMDVRVVNENVQDVHFDEDVDLVALSCMVTTATRGYEIADEFRKRGVPVIMGGYHPFVAHHRGWMEEEVFQHADSICISEGDYVWPEILEDASRGRLNRLYRQEQPTDMAQIRHRFVTSRWHWLRYGFLTIQASRGCPFHCNFCSIVMMLGNTMRYKPPEAVMAELEKVYQEDILGRTVGRLIFLVDDNVYGTPREFKELLRGLIRLNRKHPRFKPYFGSQLTINISRDKEALELLKEAGFSIVFVGLESLDPLVLRSYEKYHNVAFDYARAVKTLRSYGVEMVCSFIFGQDLETPEVFDQVFRFIQENDIVYPCFNILVPNQDQWAQFHDEGRLLSQEWKLYDALHTVFVPMKMRPIELQQGFIDLMNRVFDYENTKERLIEAFVKGGSRQFELPYLAQLGLYWKTLLALALKRDWEGYRFVRDLAPYILKNELSMINVIYQIDQHDFAVQSRATLDEHGFELDVPSWEERMAAGGAEAAG